MKGCSTPGCKRPYYAKGLCNTCYARARRNPGAGPRQFRGTCTLVGCKDSHLAKGLCEKHYRRWRRYGDPMLVRRSQTECSLRGCHEPHFGLGYCRVHYNALKYHGDPRGIGGARSKRRSPEERFDLRVNKDELPPCWIMGNNGAAGHIMVKGKSVPAARFAYERWVGTIPDGHRVIHTCHIIACVNPNHLDITTPKGVVANMGHRHSRGSNHPPIRVSRRGPLGSTA